MDFRILGPVEVLTEDQPLQFGGQRQRALLAYLLLHANEAISGERLLGEIWTEPPGGGIAALQSQISRLRRILGDRIITSGRGYAIRVEPGELDLERFRALLAEAGLAADPSERVRLLHDAEAMWRGAPLGDLDVPYASTEASALEELRLDALEDRIEAELETGLDGDLVSELSALVARYPLRERLRGQLMLALYRSGRQTESLEVYRDAHRVLVQEIGVEPGPALRQLERAILNQAPELDLAAGEPKRAARRSGDGRRRSIVFAAVALAAASIVVAIGFIERGSAASKAGTPPDSVAVVDAATGHLAADLPVGTAPSSIAVAPGSVWVANQGDESLTKIDALHGRVSIPAVHLTTNGDSSITAVAVADGGVWALDSYVGSLTRIPVNAFQHSFAPGYDLYRAVLPVRDRYANDYMTLTAGAGHLWITSNHFSAVFELTPGSARVQRRIAIPGHPVAATVGQGSVWSVTTLEGSGLLVRINPATHAVVARIPLLGTPTAVAAGFGAVWVAIPDRNLLYKIDESTNSVVRTIHVPGAPIAIAVGAGGVWVVEGTRRRLLRLDPISGSTVAAVALNGTPHALAVADRRVWVAGA